MKTFEEHASAIKMELDHAKEKHPRFADFITPYAAAEWVRKENHYKEINDLHEKAEDGEFCWYADMILAEEVSEAMAAAANGFKDHAIQEFYQVCAVALRCIELLDEQGAA